MEIHRGLPPGTSGPLYIHSVAVGVKRIIHCSHDGEKTTLFSDGEKKDLSVLDFGSFSHRNTKDVFLHIDPITLPGAVTSLMRCGKYLVSPLRGASGDYPYKFDKVRLRSAFNPWVLKELATTVDIFYTSINSEKEE